MDNKTKVYICKNCGHSSIESDKCPICGCDELEEFYVIETRNTGAEPIWTTGDTVVSQWDGLLQQQEIYPGQTNWVTTTTNSGTYVDMANWIK